MDAGERPGDGDEHRLLPTARHTPDQRRVHRRVDSREAIEEVAGTWAAVCEQIGTSLPFIVTEVLTPNQG